MKRRHSMPFGAEYRRMEACAFACGLPPRVRLSFASTWKKQIRLFRCDQERAIMAGLSSSPMRRSPELFTDSD
jgi:hypothetical protein